MQAHHRCRVRRECENLVEHPGSARAIVRRNAGPGAARSDPAWPRADSTSCGLECTQTIERVQRVQHGDRRGGLASEPGQKRRRLLELPFHQQPPRGLAPPEMRAADLGRELLRAEPAHVRGRSTRGVRVGQPPDAAVVLAIDQAVLLLQVTRDRRIVLDDLAVEVDDEDAAVRRVRQGDRVKPGIARREELGLLLARRTTQRQPGAVALDDRAMDEVLRRLAGQQLSAQAGQRDVLVHQRRTGRREVAVRGGLLDAVAITVVLREARIVRPSGAPGMRLARRINPLVGRGGLFERRRGDVRIAGQVPPRQRGDEDARRPASR